MENGRENGWADEGERMNGKWARWDEWEIGRGNGRKRGGMIIKDYKSVKGRL